MPRLILLSLPIFSALFSPANAADAPRVLFTRMIAHWDAYGDPDYLKFVDEARPEVAQVGFTADISGASRTPRNSRAIPRIFPWAGSRNAANGSAK